MIHKHMEAKGTKFLTSSVPVSIVEVEGGRKRVTYRNVDTGVEASEEFDTVLSAIGRNADVEVCVSSCACGAVSRRVSPCVVVRIEGGGGEVKVSPAHPWPSSTSFSFPSLSLAGLVPGCCGRGAGQGWEAALRE